MRNPAYNVTKEINLNNEAQNKTKTNKKSKQKNKEIMKENKHNKKKDKILSLNQKQLLQTFGLNNTLEAINENMDLNRVQHQQKIREIIKQWNILPTSMSSWNRVRDIVDRYCNNITSFKMNNWKLQKNQSKLIMLGSAVICVNNAKKTRCMEGHPKDVNNEKKLIKE